MADTTDMAARMRRRDPDRYFCALFAPAAHRHALLTLAAFNDELARARELTTEPGLALIRLHWWREVVEGAPRRHEVADPLRAVIAAYRLPTALLLEMIESREADIESPPPTLQSFLHRMHHGPGALAAASAAILGADALTTARIRALGAAYGITGTLRNIAPLATRELSVLPLDLLAAANLVPETAFTNPAQVLNVAHPALAEAARALLGPVAPLPRTVLAAALPGVFARRDAAREQPIKQRGAGDQLAVLWAAVTGRV
jgi:15-cis-phytoene synthase